MTTAPGEPLPLSVTAVIHVARQAGAREIVTTDLLDPPLAVAAKIGAGRTIDTRSNPNGLDAYAANKGAFDVVFEASGAPQALATAITVARPVPPSSRSASVPKRRRQCRSTRWSPRKSTCA